MPLRRVSSKESEEDNEVPDISDSDIGEEIKIREKKAG